MLKTIESSLRLSSALVEVLHREFDCNCRAVDLFQQFLDYTTYSRQFALRMIDVAGGKLGDSLEIRRLAALMLQEHLLGLDATDLAEFEFVLPHLGLQAGHGGKMPKSVLKEGYSCRDLAGFVLEFRRRLTKPRCAVRPRTRQAITSDAVSEFAHQSRQECKLVLARYLFSPDEVVARIHSQVKRSSGVSLSEEPEFAQGEWQRIVGDLPDYEASILQKLQMKTSVFWVADETSSKLNSLVEYPLGTVVLVIKPPGSHYEFELKRAGRRGSHPLSARSHVPPSHRLDGGSMVSALQWDQAMTVAFGELFRRVHDQPAPVPHIVHLLGKSDVPVDGGECPIIEFLTDRSIYGEGYDVMRKAMAIVVECFRKERGNITPPIPGDYGLTAQFYAFTGPAQATICGSSSFRLDSLANYLSADGPVKYFTNGLGIEYQDEDAKRLADDLFDEVLGVYDPPTAAYRDYEQYVTAALAVPANRARANGNYCDLLKQIGRMWGTLLAVRGYSFGESFVSRNVGLRTVWSQGEWTVRLIFHDHDNLVLPGNDQSQFWPMTALSATRQDHCFISGRHGKENLEFELDSLRRIYRVEESVRKKAHKRLRKSLQRAYIKTQKTLRSDPQLHTRFDQQFIERLRDWDRVARKYLARNGSSNDTDWKRRVKKFLRKRGYNEKSIQEHCQALETHGSFVEEHAFLHRAKIKKA